MKPGMKKVNVFPKRPLFRGYDEIRNDTYGIEMSVGDIRTVLQAGGRVEEILEDGTVINLTYHNYNDPNRKPPKLGVITPSSANNKSAGSANNTANSKVDVKHESTPKPEPQPQQTTDNTTKGNDSDKKENQNKK